MAILTIFLSLFIFLSSAGSYALEKFVSFDKQNSGLSNDKVRCIITDSRGYVWIGTEMGLNRFDGTRMQKFKSEDYHLPSSYIFSLFEDKSGNVWIGTSAGTSYYDYHKDRFIVPVDSVGKYPDDIISSFACDSRGHVWFSPNMSGVLYECDVVSSRLIPHSFGFENGPKYLTFDQNDRLILISNLSIFSFGKDDEKPVMIVSHPVSEQSFNNRIRGPVVSRSSNEIVYFATETGFFDLNLSSGVFRMLHKWQFNGQLPICLFPQDDGSVVISTSKGLMSYNPHSEMMETLISDEFVMGFAPCRSGSFWVGLHSAGIRYYGPELSFFKSTVKLNDGTSLHSAGFTSVTQTTDGKVWLATEKLGVLVYSPVQYCAERCIIPGLSNPVNSICSDGENLWIGNGNGLYHYETDKRLLSRISSIPISRIYKTFSGELLVGNKTVLMQLDKSNHSLSELKGFDIPAVVSQRGVVEDRDGRYWIPTYTSGVYMYDSKLKKTEWFPMDGEDDTVGSGRMVTSVFVDSFGAVWVIGHDAEIRSVSVNNSHSRRYNLENHESFPQASFLSAEQSSDGTLWIASSSGLVHFDQKSGSTTLFNDKNGLKDNNFCEPSKTLLSGDLLFTTASGVLQFSPGSFNFTNRRVDVTSFRIGDKIVKLDHPINETESVRIPSSNNSFGFQFASPGTITPSSFQCRLLNYEDEWRCIGGESVYYYNVPAGKYIFQIKGHNDISIIIVPPFWSTAPGIVLIVLISLSIALLIVYYVIKKRRKQEKEKEKERIISEKLGFLSGFVALEQFETDNVKSDFMKRMDDVVTRHLSDSDFDVEMLAKELAMSHRSLTRYSSSVFNATPVEYIRTKRLAVASHLLAQGGYSISEISYKCGFNSPAYFTKCYKDAYGVAPSILVNK